MSTFSAFSWNNSRILIADDEPDMREIFSAWFRSLGCFVQEVADGLAALEAVTANRFDVIVTDVRMPRLDGIHLVQRLHESGTYTPVVIFVSGFVDLPIPDALDLGVEAVLSKPCERKVLLNAVQRSLLRRNLDFVPLDSVQPPPQENYVRDSPSRGSADLHVALGRGGMSLDVLQPVFADGTIGFALTVADDAPLRLEGWGLLRWCNPFPGGNRVGIEFLHLAEPSRAQFARWLARHSPVSFIPKESRTRAAISR